MGGRDRTLSFQARGSGVERRVQVTATEPRLLGVGLPMIVNLLGERREEVGFTVERESAAVRIENQFRPRWTAYTRYNFQRVDLLDVENPDGLRQQKLENIQLGDLSFAVVRDTRDDPFRTTRGAQSSVEVRVFAPAFLSESTFLKGYLQTAVTRPVAERYSWAWAVRIGLAEPRGSTASVPLSERFFAGGDSTLRGFPRDEVGPIDNGTPTGGEALLLLNQEFRFPIWSRLRGVLFYDTGNVYATLGDLDPTDLRHVLGAGLRLETPIGPIRIEYGHKLDREFGESSGELFVAIGAAF